MKVLPPILDDRELEDILQQLRALASVDVPEWLPPTQGDAGTMLQRAYARLIEIVLHRLNQVPEKNLLAFLDVMGVSLLAPSPARAPLTFGLTKDTPPTLIARGAQATSKATDTRPAVIFETEDDLTVIPAQITQSYTIDPVWDRYTEQTPVLGGQSPIGYTPFVGTKRMPHLIYFGDDALLDFSRRAAVRLRFNFDSGGRPVAEMTEFLARLVYRYRSQGTLKSVSPSVTPTVTGSDAEIQFSMTEPIDVEALQGVGAAGPLQTLPRRWLQAVLTTPLPDTPLGQALRMSTVKLHVSAAGLLPDFAFTNNAPVDVTKDFFPLGETPKVGDTFYIASREALNKPGAVVTLNARVRPPDPPKLIWEYFSQKERSTTFSQKNPWTQFVVLDLEEVSENSAEIQKEFERNPFSFIADGTRGLTKDGLIMAFAVEMQPTSINGVFADWVRVRIDEGRYQSPPLVTAFLAAFENNTSRPPSDGFANRTRLNLGQPFSPFGTAPGEGDIFYFGEQVPFSRDGGGFPSIQIKDIPVTFIVLAVTLRPDTRPDPKVTLRWEYLSREGWQEMPAGTTNVPGVSDRTRAFTEDGTIELRLPPATRPTPVEAKVNDQSDYWVRVRIDGGNYGRATEFVQVDPDDPTQGFKVRPGTGNLRPPQLTSLTIDYRAEGRPTVITRNGFLYRDASSSEPTFFGFPGFEFGFKPFVLVSELVPSIYADAEPTLYLGLDAAFPEEPVTFYADIAPRAFAGGVIKETRRAPSSSSQLPPLRWEYFNGTAWRELTVFDATNNFTASGTVSFLTPEDIAPLAKFDLTARFWVRARSARNDPFDTQHLLGIFLNTIPALQATTIRNEIIGSSSEEPNQTHKFASTPVLPGQEVYVREPEPPSDKERERIEEEQGADAISEVKNPDTDEMEVWVRWHEIDTFLKSDRQSRHYTLNHITGELRFGDGERGLIPPRGTNNLTANYRTGGGQNGNVEKGGIAQVKSALAGVGSVLNQVGADGGAEVETIPMVEERGPQTLRHRTRAVSSGDMEWLARQATGTRVARSRCLSNVNRELRFEPGWATLMVVPGGQESKLSPSSELIREVEDYLDERAFMGLSEQTPSRINVIGPGYIRVAAVAKVVPADIDEAEAVKKLLVAALNAFLHPLTGGPKDTGWEFGRDVYASEIAQALEDIGGVNHVETLQLVANVAQHRLTFSSVTPPVKDLPAGSEVITNDLRKSAVLAETVSSGSAVERIKIKGFKEGDVLTKALDVRVTNVVRVGAGFRIDVKMPDGSPLFADTVGFPLGSLVTTFDGAGRMRLAAAIGRSRPSVTLPITEIFVENNAVASNLSSVRADGAPQILTIFYPFPMKVTGTKLETITLMVQAVSGNQITVAAFNSAVTSVPINSIVSAEDDTRRAHLQDSIPANQTGLTTIRVRETAFAALLQPGDELEVYAPVQTLGIEPYETEVLFPAGSLIATTDNRVRLPLLTAVPAELPVTSITLHDFISTDPVSVNRRDRTFSLSGLQVESVEPLSDIVFLDDNFLVYSGAHRITMMGEAKE